MEITIHRLDASFGAVARIFHPAEWRFGYAETAKLSEVLLQLNETSLSQLRRDHETDHLEQKISQASKQRASSGL